MTNFDRVADIYDETRGLPREALERVTDRIMAATHAEHETRFLEIGVGTGRIALPLVERGVPYTGVDISEKMLARLRQKVANRSNLTLIQGDATQLPFPDDSFDVALLVHVLHLTPEWETILTEIQRVLAPAGYLVLGDDQPLSDSPAAVIRRQWRTLVEEAGATLAPRHGTWERVINRLCEEDWWIAVYRAWWGESEIRPIEYIERLHNRTFSNSWSVSDEALEKAHAQLVPWAKETYGDLSKPIPSGGEFLLAVARTPHPVPSAPVPSVPPVA